ncbi:MAG: O-antigen ligase family protein [Phycisphaerales bacterium]|nr:O-antigen ligase family protein [Phycisphaerales bacterium]
MTSRVSGLLSWIALVGTLLIVFIRTNARQAADVTGLGSGGVGSAGFIGPGELVGLAAIGLLFLSIALLAAGKAPRMFWPAAGLIACLMALGGASAWLATDKFAAIIGWCDMALGLCGGLVAMLTANDFRRRQFAFAFLILLFAGFCAKGLYQRMVEIPDTIRFFNAHQDQSLRENGLAPGTLDARLFEARMNSREVTGFFYLSDAFAEALTPLIVLAAAMALALLSFYQEPAPEAQPFQRKRRSSSSPPGQNAIPLRPFLLTSSIILALVGLVVTWLTRSKGGLASSLICLIGLAMMMWKWRAIISRYRWRIYWAGLLTVALLAAAVLAYGLITGSLPTKSLRFRWQYWCGAAPIIIAHPWLGVGLNNFGQYYTQYKLPSAPEDVKNPHSVFIRAAAEMGIPAAVLLVGLFAAAFALVCRQTQDIEDHGLAPLLPVNGGAFIVAAWGARMALVTSTPMLDAILAVIYGTVSFGGYYLGATAFKVTSPSGRRFLMFALAIGCAGMLLYDQVNMALLTGPVAMLLTLMLGLVVAPAASSTGETKRYTPITLAAAVLSTIAAVVIIGWLWIPIMRRNLPFDPRPVAREYTASMKTHNYAKALAAANHALKLDPRSQNWLMRTIGLQIALGENPAANVHRLLSLNRADARFRIALVENPHCGLSRDERLAQLRLALQLNSQLPKNEVQRLSPQEVASIRAFIRQLTKSQ